VALATAVEDVAAVQDEIPWNSAAAHGYQGHRETPGLPANTPPPEHPAPPYGYQGRPGNRGGEASSDFAKLHDPNPGDLRRAALPIGGASRHQRLLATKGRRK